MVLAFAALLALEGADVKAEVGFINRVGLITQEVTPEFIIKKYIEAVGGEEAVRGVRNLEMTMEAEVQGMAVKIKGVTDQENDRALNVTEMNGNVVAKSIINGDVGKVISMGQEQQLTEEQIQSVKNQKYIFQELHLDELGYSVSYGGKENADGEEVYKLILKDGNGYESIEYYSVDSGLKVMTKSDLAGEVKFKDYKEVDGLMMPMKMVVSNTMMPMPMEVTVVSIVFNQELDENLFN